MRKNELFLYLIISLSMLIPVPGRFAYGIVILLLFNILMLLGTLFRNAVHLWGLDDMEAVLLVSVLITISILYKQLLILVSPLMALSLGICIYMPALSSFLIGYLYEKENGSLSHQIIVNCKISVKFSLFALAIFLFRDICGYGTITFPMHNGIFEIFINTHEKSIVSVFWASIPGAMILAAILVLLLAVIDDKIDQVKDRLASAKKKAEDSNADSQ